MFTLGFLEKDDLALTLAAAHERFGIDPDRIGIHACSAGSSVALEFAAGRSGIRAIWLESPFAEPREMARHYLSRATKVPASLLTLTAHWAISRAVARVRRELGVERAGRGHRASRPDRRRRARNRGHTPRSRRRRPARTAALHAAAGRGPAAAKRRLERRGRRPLPPRGRAGRHREDGLCAPVGGVLQDLSAGVGRRRRGSSVLPFSCPQAAEASGPLLRRTVTVIPASAIGRTNAASALSSGRFQPGR